MKVTIKGQINYRPALWDGDGPYHFHPCDISGCTKIMDHSIDVEIPDDFDLRGEQVKALQAEKIKLMAEFQALCTEIERKISELTAISCEVQS